MTSRSFQRLALATPARASYRSKYRNRRVVIDGESFDSAGEARRYGELKLLERAGQITQLKRQERIALEVNKIKVCTYVADFTYCAHGARIVEDFKGVETPLFKLKAKLLKALTGVSVTIVKGRR